MIFKLYKLFVYWELGKKLFFFRMKNIKKIIILVLLLIPVSFVKGLLPAEYYYHDDFIITIGEIVDYYNLDINMICAENINLDSIFSNLEQNKNLEHIEDSIYYIFNDVIKIKQKEIINFYMAGYSYSIGDTIQALNWLRTSTEINSKFIPSLFFQSIIYYDLEKYDMAIKALKNILEINFYEINTLKFLVHLYDKNTEYGKALILINRIIQQFPTEPSLYVRRGIFNLKLSKNEQAELDFSLYIKNRKDTLSAIKERSQFFESLGEHKLAIKDLKNALTFNENKKGLYRSIFRNASQINDLDECLNAMDNLIKMYPYDYNFYFKRSEVYKKMELLDKAEEDENKSNKLEQYYNLAKNYYRKGYDYSKRKMYDSALIAYQKSLEFIPDYLNSIQNISDIYQLKKQYDSAEFYYKKKIEIESNEYSNYLNYGNFFKNIESYKNAIYYYNKALIRKPTSTTICNKIGLTFAKLKQYDSAEFYYRKAITINRNYAHGWNNIGIIFDDFYESDSAIFYFSKAIEADTNYMLGYSNRGNQYLNEGEFDLAIKDFKKALIIEPKDTFSLNKLTWAFFNKKDYNNALITCKSLSLLRPNDAFVYRLLGKIYYRFDSLKKVSEYFDKAMKLDSNMIKE
jgi:tetratricopeptide (TPR) repeat protein